MESLEQEIIKRQSSMIGQLSTAIMELEIKLHQAIATAQAFQEELEGLQNGNTEQQNATGRETSPTEGV